MRSTPRMDGTRGSPTPERTVTSTVAPAAGQPAAAGTHSTLTSVRPRSMPYSPAIERRVASAVAAGSPSEACVMARAVQRAAASAPSAWFCTCPAATTR